MHLMLDDLPGKVFTEKSLVWNPMVSNDTRNYCQLKCIGETTILQIPEVSIHRITQMNPTLLRPLLNLSVTIAEGAPSKLSFDQDTLIEYSNSHYSSTDSSFDSQNSPSRRRLHEVPLLDDSRKIRGIRDWNGVLRHVATYDEKYYQHNSDGVSTYLKCCMTLGIRPIYPVLHDLQSGKETLALQGVGVTATQTQAVSAAIMRSDVLTRIDLSHNPITDSGCVGHKEDTPGMLDALAANRRIESLDLSQTSLTHGVGRALGIALDNHPLKHLNMSSNHLGDRGVEYLSKILHTCYLEELNLSNNRISNNGACFLANALRGNLTLKILDLSWNHILQQGSVSLFQSLEENSCIEEFSLNWNYIGHGGGMAMTEMLRQNGKLRFLDVSNCNLAEECCEEISSSLKANSGLECIIMRWNPLRNGVRSIMQVAKNKGLKAQLDHCGLNSIELQSETLNSSCLLTGPYVFDLANHEHRSNLKPLIEHGYRSGGENWRNESLDGQRLAINWNDKLSLPDNGVLRFDFIDLEIADLPTISKEDFRRLRKLFLHANSSADRMFLIREACGTFVCMNVHALRH